MQVNGAYNFRQTGNGISGFTPRNCSPVYVGATFAWNQLVQRSQFASAYPSGSTFSYDSGTDKTSYTGTISTGGYGYLAITPFPVQKNHIYFESFSLNGDLSNVNNVWGKVDNIGATGQTTLSGGIYRLLQKSTRTVNTGNSLLVGFSAPNGTPLSLEVSKLCVTDLTLAFGSTIADYAYTLESGNAGAGVAWLQSQGFFKNDYYAYDSVSLQNVETEKAINTGLDSLVHTYALGHATLRGVPQLDANNNIYYQGDTYESSGKITRKCKIVNLGDLSWGYNTSYDYPYFFANTGSNGAALLSGQISVVCTKYAARNNVSAATFRSNDNNKLVCVNLSSGTGRGLLIQDTAYTDATAFKTAMDGVYLVYIAATSGYTTETTASFESLMFAEAGGTEQLVDYAYNHSTRDVEIPIGADNDYGVIRYAGYLLAVRDTQDAFTPIPLEYMRYESYNVAPDQRLDLDTTRDTTGVLHRTVLAHTATKVSFNVPSMPGWRIQELLGYFRTAFKQTNGDTQAHKLELKYYDEWEDDYKTGIMYMPDIQFQIRNIDGSTINYCETKVTFIEY